MRHCVVVVSDTLPFSRWKPQLCCLCLSWRWSWRKRLWRRAGSTEYGTECGLGLILREKLPKALGICTEHTGKKMIVRSIGWLMFLIIESTVYKYSLLDRFGLFRFPLDPQQGIFNSFRVVYHHYRFTAIIITYGLWSVWDLYRAIPAVSRDRVLCGLVCKTVPFSRNARQAGGAKDLFEPRSPWETLKKLTEYRFLVYRTGNNCIRR